MTLIVECLTTLTPQDRQDLALIWPHQDIARLEHSLNEHRRLYVSRFNGHLLAGLIVEIDGDSAELTDLKVRESTRRRGIGKYLVEEALRTLPQVREWWLDAASHAMVDEAVMDKFMQTCGFYPVSGGWELTR